MSDIRFYALERCEQTNTLWALDEILLSNPQTLEDVDGQIEAALAIQAENELEMLRNLAKKKFNRNYRYSNF